MQGDRTIVRGAAPQPWGRCRGNRRRFFLAATSTASAIPIGAVKDPRLSLPVPIRTPIFQPHEEHVPCTVSGPFSSSFCPDSGSGSLTTTAPARHIRVAPSNEAQPAKRQSIAAMHSSTTLAAELLLPAVLPPRNPPPDDSRGPA